jgi:spermidine synthase
MSGAVSADLAQTRPVIGSRASMRPWETLARAVAPDGAPIELRRRGHELLIRAGGHDLMSSDDETSSRALATLALSTLSTPARRVLVGGLGMGFTLRAALDEVGPDAVVEVAELVPAVAEWGRGPIAPVADRPLDDRRARLHVGDVAERIRAAQGRYDAILLDVDNGPDALAHEHNEGLYQASGLRQAHRALRPGGVLAVWSFSDDRAFTRRLREVGFVARVEPVPASRKGRGRTHYVWVARR